ncbi:MAG: MBOAT family protein [Butyrivibrio sp.]|nr:MBOAT family protein [Butyrivibrio sp.]
MLFNSYEYVLLFLPVFIIGFYLIKKLFANNEYLGSILNIWIIAASLLFYTLFGIKNLCVLSCSILVNAIVALLISSAKKRGKKPGLWILAAGLILNVATLLLFKYSGTFFPIAISFYTFNQISYLVDLYRDEVKEFDPLTYLTYILFFPKLLQGPMMGYEPFAKELDKAVEMSFSWENVLRGLYFFSMGLFKKVILADTFGAAVGYGYENVATLGSLEAVLVAVFYSFQLYFDFSGYCDMAMGVCRIMGFDLVLNFNSPYKARSISEFWDRWHITLTKFFTKYVYIPLGGSRKGRLRTYVNILVVFLLSGIWHGSGVTFVIWGAMHGIGSVVNRALREIAGRDKNEKPEKEGVFISVVKTAVTFIYVTVAWVFFRAESVKDALTLIGRMFNGGKKPISTHLSSCFQLDELWYVIKVTPIMKLQFAWDVCLWLFVIASAVVIFLGKNAVERAGKAKIGIKTTVVTAALLTWCILSFAGVSTFLYMNF